MYVSNGEGEIQWTLSSLLVTSVFKTGVYEQFLQGLEIERPNISRVRIQSLAEA